MLLLPIITGLSSERIKELRLQVAEEKRIK